jgi:hypothetical protein
MIKNTDTCWWSLWSPSTDLDNSSTTFGPRRAIYHVADPRRIMFELRNAPMLRAACAQPVGISFNRVHFNLRAPVIFNAIWTAHT